MVVLMSNVLNGRTVGVVDVCACEESSFKFIL